jgi:hypothetical protein
MSESIKVTGIREFQRALRAMNTDLPKQVRIVLNEAGQIIVDYDQRNMPRRSGRAIASVKARSSQRQARVVIGGSRAPYVAWLDFGGEGRRKGRPAARPFIKEGRYTYKGLRVRRDDITEVMARGLAELAKSAGLEVTGG